MNDEQRFRLILLLVFVVFIPVGIYHRLKSRTGEKLDRRQEGIFIRITLRAVAVVGMAGMIAWFINPATLAWASLPLPLWMRWTGVGLAALAGALGHPVGAILVPWNDGPNWEVNPNFVAHVKKAASVDRPIVLICRSGNRSLDAGRALEESGFTQVYNVLHGFEGELDENHHRGSKTGWRFEGLPWEQC